MEPAAAPLPVPAPAQPPPPPPIAPPPAPIAPPPVAEDTKLLAAAPDSPADNVLWALHGQALGRGHPHLLQLRVRRLTARHDCCQQNAIMTALVVKLGVWLMDAGSCIFSWGGSRDFCTEGFRTMCLQEVEAQPQQLAVVVDRSFSTVQDLIDNTACMVRIMRRSCQSDS